MTDLTTGKKFCRVSGTWLDPAEYARRHANYEELAFRMRPSQGELCTPMIIADTMRPVVSMTNGQTYDAKSELRKEYRRAGVQEVGNDVPMKKAEPTRYERDAARKKRRGSIARALSQTGFGA